MRRAPNRPPTATIEERFFRDVQKTETCWLWIGQKTTTGYGKIYISRRHEMKAHRMSYTLHIGEIPEGLFVCHRCDVPLCVRPDHLFLGTGKENTADMVSKGREAWGERGNHGAMTLDLVIEIRRLHGEGVPQHEIRRRLGTGLAQTSRIVNNKIWKRALPK